MIRPRLTAFDLDGTLAESKQRMSPQMSDLLARLLTRMPAAVLSGGSWEQFQHQFLVGLPPETKLDQLYLFPTNAAICFVHRQNEWHPQYDNRFSDEEKANIMKAFEESFAEANFVQPPQIWGQQIEDRGGEITFSALGQEAPIEEKQKYDKDRSKRTPLADALRRRLPHLSISVNAATSIDITPHGVDKAYGLTRLSELTGIPIADMLFIGDALQEGGNDSVVIKTGIQTHPVLSPNETEEIIEELLR